MKVLIAKSYFYPGLLVLLTLIVFFGVTKNDFVNFDDPEYILNNPNVKDFSSEKIGDIFNDKIYSHSYKPVTVLVWGLTASVFGLNPIAFHAVSLFFHLLVVLLVYFILQYFIKGPPVFIFLLSLIFAIHPTKVESIAWATELKDTLFGFFYLSSFALYLLYKKKHLFWLMLGAVVFGGLALLSKSVAISLPLVIIAVEWLYFKESFKKNISVYIGVILLLLFAGIFYGFLMGNTATEQGSFNETAENIIFKNQGFFDVIIISSYRVVHWILHVIYPVDLLPIYMPPKAFLSGDNIPVLFYMYPLILIGFFAFIYMMYKMLRFPVILFLLTLAPGFIITVKGTNFLPDRYLYLPLLGLVLILGVVIKSFKENHKNVIYLLISILIVILSVLTIKQIKIWENSMVLWSTLIEKSPKVAIAYNNRADLYVKTGELNAALNDYNKAVKNEPEASLFYVNRGGLYERLGQDKKALADYNHALKINKSLYKTKVRRGVVFGKLGNYNKAFADFNAVIQQHPSYHAVYADRATAFYLVKNYSQAKMDYLKAIELNPNVGFYYMNLANTYLKLNDGANACKYSKLAYNKGVKSAKSIIEKVCR